VRMPGGLGDVWTVRLIQQALASQPTADASGEVALRYGQWQRSLAGLGAASQALDPGGEPGKSSLPESGLGLWFERCGEVTGARGLQHVELPGTAARTVHEVAACLGVEACAVLLGCWRMVLHAMGCTEPIWVAVNGRRPPVAADAAGPLTAYRRWSDAEAGNRSVVDTLRRAGTWLGEAVVRQPAWDDSQAPRGLPALAFSPVPAPERIEIAGGTAELLAPTPAPFGQTMDLAAWLRNDRLGLALSFDTGRLRPADIAGVLATLGRVITDLPSLARGQAPWRGRSRTVARTPPAPSSARDPLDIWRRLAACAAAHPTAPALGCGGRRLTYQELITRAAAVAHWLRQAGVRRGDRLGLLVEESPDMVIALIGIYAAGAAYVPLQSHLPTARMAAILTAAEVSVTVSSPALCGLLPPGASVLRLDSAPREPASGWQAADGDGLAYVLFTSGSGGAPKGVLVSRCGLSNYLDWAARSYPFGEGNGVITYSSAMFDLSVTSYLAPLIAGSYVHVVPSDEPIEAVHGTMRQLGDVSLLKLTPSHMSLLLRTGGQGEATVRAVVAGGEDLGTNLVERWRQRYPGCAVFNEYGPTETVVGCTVFQADGREAGLDTVPIGSAIDGMRTYVLDDTFQPLERGVPGELFIGGVGVAWGYAGDPRRTAERFLPDPFGSPGSVMYRSGDVAVNIASCGLRFGGRVDRQAKLHGYRIEPGEVEYRMREMPNVAEAVARVTTLPSGERALVAYVVTSDGAAFDVTTAREVLGRNLPHYLIPSLFRTLPELPLTASGKLDEQRLPELQGPSVPWVKAATPSQQLVSQVWTEVLGFTPPGPDTPFFEAGGSSYTLVKAHALLSAELQRDIPIASMFEHPTVRRLAAFLDQAEAPGAVAETPPIAPVGLQREALSRMRARREQAR
jgi:amino acid adenylation domain-containing protein